MGSFSTAYALVGYTQEMNIAGSYDSVIPAKRESSVVLYGFPLSYSCTSTMGWPSATCFIETELMQ